MEFLALFAILLLIIGASLYLLVCVDPNSPNIFGIISRFIFTKVPILLKKIFGEKIFGLFSKSINYFFYSNHPLVQIFYVIVAVGGYLVYLYFGFLELFEDNIYVSHLDTAIGSVLALFCFYSFFQACRYGPGIITQENNQQYINEFKNNYDNVLYLKDNLCKTCNIIKPARSKHCRICNVCVSRFDHHCVWVKQCIGQKNYKYFVKFIILHAILCDYGAYLGYRCLYGIIIQENLFNAQFRDPITKQRLQAGWGIIFKYIFYKNTMYVFIVLLCVVMGIALTLFAIYHLSMISKDTTTNEKMKRSDFLSFFEEETEKLEKQLKNAKTEDEIKEISQKLDQCKSCQKRIKPINKIGLWKGLKRVFKIKQNQIMNQLNCYKHNKPLQFVVINSENQQLCCCLCISQTVPKNNIVRLDEFLKEEKQKLTELQSNINKEQKQFAQIYQQHSNLMTQITQLSKKITQLYDSNKIDQNFQNQITEYSNLLNELQYGQYKQQEYQNKFNRGSNIKNNIFEHQFLTQNQWYQLSQIYENQLLSKESQILYDNIQKVFQKQQQQQQQQQQQKYQQNNNYFLYSTEYYNQVEFEEIKKEKTEEIKNDKIKEIKKDKIQEIDISSPLVFRVQKDPRSQTPDNLQRNEQSNFQRQYTPNSKSQISYQLPQENSNQNIIQSIKLQPNSKLNQSTISQNNNNGQQYQFKSGILYAEQLQQKQKIEQDQQKSTLSISMVKSPFPKTEKLYAIKAHDKRISAIQVGPHCIFTSSYDKFIRVWDKLNGKLLSTLEGHTKAIVALAFKYDTLASSGEDKTIRIWKHHPRWQLIGNLKGHYKIVNCIDFYNSKYLISGSGDQSVKIWDLDKQMEFNSLQCDFIIYSLLIDNDYLYIGGNGIIQINFINTLQNINQTKVYQFDDSPITKILLINKNLIAIEDKGQITIIDQNDNRNQLKDDYDITSAAYLQQYNLLAVGLSTKSGEGKICFWSLETMRKVKEIYDNGSGVGGLCWENPYLWSGHDNKRLECLKFTQFG